MYADARFWDRIAESYSAKPVDDPDAFERKIAITKGLMVSDHVIADFGCGTGSLVLRLADQAAHVHGVDVSPNMIRIARGKAMDQGVTNVTFHVSSLEDHGTFEPGGLDGVLAYSLLHLVEDPRAVLAKLFGLLKPGGYFVSSTVCIRDTWIPKPLLTLMRWAGRAPSIQVFGRRRLLEYVREAGFVDIETPDVGASSRIAFVVARRPAG